MALVNKTVLDEFIFKAFVETEQFLKHKKIQVNMYFLKSLIAQKYYAFDEIDVNIQNYHTFFLHYFKMHFKNKTGHLYNTDEFFIKKVKECLYETSIQLSGVNFLRKNEFDIYFTHLHNKRTDLDTLIAESAEFLFNCFFQHSHASLLSQWKTVNKHITEKTNTAMNSAYLDLENRSLDAIQTDIKDLNITSYQLEQQVRTLNRSFLMGGHTLASYTTFLQNTVADLQKNFAQEEHIFAEIFQPIFEQVNTDIAILQTSFKKSLDFQNHSLDL